MTATLAPNAGWQIRPQRTGPVVKKVAVDPATGRARTKLVELEMFESSGVDHAANWSQIGAEGWIVMNADRDDGRTGAHYLRGPSDRRGADQENR